MQTDNGSTDREGRVVVIFCFRTGEEDDFDFNYLS